MGKLLQSPLSPKTDLLLKSSKSLSMYNRAPAFSDLLKTFTVKHLSFFMVEICPESNGWSLQYFSLLLLFSSISQAFLFFFFAPDRKPKITFHIQRQIWCRLLRNKDCLINPFISRWQKIRGFCFLKNVSPFPILSIHYKTSTFFP